MEFHATRQGSPYSLSFTPYFSCLFHSMGNQRGRVCYGARQPICHQLDLVSTSMFWWESGFGTRTMQDFNSCFFQDFQDLQITFPKIILIILILNIFCEISHLLPNQELAVRR